ncbi:unnamed protein product [Ilex paraguariensis]|uniref:Uncharacterized protein n=1 Tax=Ilex paraguariensis TaxID=185542 RepID=A0ABC8UNI2_9AQUA
MALTIAWFWNVATREFRLLPLPYSIFPPYFSSFWHVFGFGLDILTNNYKFILIRSFWDEQMNNPYPFYVVALYTLEVMRPLGFWKNQDLLCESNTSLLVLYKRDTNEPTNLGIHGGDTYGGLSVFSYKESLVSVKGPNED